MIKKPKIDPEIVKRRNAARSQANRERKRIEEVHRESVLSLLEQNTAEDLLYRPSVFRAYNDNAYRTTEDIVTMRRQFSAVSYVLSQRAQSVLTSFGINPRINMSKNESLKQPVLAYTDYETINIEFNPDMFDFTDMNALADGLSAIKGVVYHEGGHLIHTIPFDVLFDCALMDNLVEPIGINRHTSWPTDKGEDHYPAYKNDFALFKSPYVSNTMSVNDAKEYWKNDARGTSMLSDGLALHKHQFDKVKDWIRPAWNILEDGRMEDIVVRGTPQMANYLEMVTLKLIVEPAKHPGLPWPMVASRMYLSDQLYDIVKQLAVDYLDTVGKPLDMVEECEEIVRKYRAASTPTDVVVACWEFANFLHKWSSSESERPIPEGRRSHYSSYRDDSHRGSQHPSGSKTPGDHDDGIPKDTEVKEKPKFSGEETDAQSTRKVKSSDRQSDNQPNDGEGSGDSEGNPSQQSKLSDKETSGAEESDTRSNSHSAGKEGSGGKIKHNVDYESLRQQLKNRTVEASRYLSNATEAEQFMADVNKELSNPMMRNQSVSPMSSQLVAKSKKVANDMLNALAPLAVTADPSWRFRQTNGVLDPVTYKTHEPGDIDYWIDYEGEGSTGHNLALSVILDTSGSMDAWMDELSVAAYGIRLACDSLEIPCTISTFDTEAFMLYSTDEEAIPLHIHDGGGTNPKSAFMQVRNQKLGKERHLIIVLTDGAWSNVKTIKPFSEPGQYWVLFALGDGSYVEHYVQDKGGDSSGYMRDVAELPKLVEKSLSNFLA
jgi:hypothetical protein